MTARPKVLSERPAGGAARVDVVSDVLRAVRLDGAFFYKVVAGAPWCVESSAALELSPRVLPSSEHLIAYHVVVEGSCWGGTAGSLHELRGGDVIVLPHGAPHSRSSAPGTPRTDAASSEIPRGARMPLEVELGGRGERALLLCGYLGCDRRPFNPLLASLPEVIVAHGRGDAWLSGFAERALSEAAGGRSGGELVLTRLAELMFIEVVRRHVEALSSGQSGWLAGLRDEVVGRALALLHEAPSRPWSLDELARETSCSRSVLSERFARLVGDPPMQYLARWRMQLAASRLAGSSAKVSAIARGVGYDSEAAFSRAFKREVGVSPAEWRSRRGSDGPG
jgi:AraC-like DNA-binding protein